MGTWQPVLLLQSNLRNQLAWAGSTSFSRTDVSTGSNGRASQGSHSLELETEPGTELGLRHSLEIETADSHHGRAFAMLRYTKTFVRGLMAFTIFAWRRSFSS